MGWQDEDSSRTSSLTDLGAFVSDSHTLKNKKNTSPQIIINQIANLDLYVFLPIFFPILEFVVALGTLVGSMMVAAVIDISMAPMVAYNVNIRSRWRKMNRCRGNLWLTGMVSRLGEEDVHAS